MSIKLIFMALKPSFDMGACLCRVLSTEGRQSCFCYRIFITFVKFISPKRDNVI